jgi:hypothetical protein
MVRLRHADARLTLSIYAHRTRRQAVDQALIWRLMRFAGEPEKPPFGAMNGPTTADLAAGTAGGFRLDAEKSA